MKNSVSRPFCLSPLDMLCPCFIIGLLVFLIFTQADIRILVRGLPVDGYRGAILAVMFLSVLFYLFVRASSLISRLAINLECLIVLVCFEN